MIRLKELEKYYSVSSHDNGKTQHLYSLTENGKYTPKKFLCYVTKVKNGWYNAPGFKPTNNLTVLIENLNEYIASLKYNPELYNPCYREGYFEYMVVFEYLRGIGFVNKDNETFTLEEKHLYGKKNYTTITIEGLDYYSRDNKIAEKVKIIFWKGEYSWVLSEEILRNPDLIIEAINNMLKPIFLYNAAINSDMAEKLEFNSIGDIKENSLNGINSVETPIKERIIKQFEDILIKLKK